MRDESWPSSLDDERLVRVPSSEAPSFRNTVVFRAFEKRSELMRLHESDEPAEQSHGELSPWSRRKIRKIQIASVRGA
jgi:hypothetical protein